MVPNVGRVIKGVRLHLYQNMASLIKLPVGTKREQKKKNDFSLSDAKLGKKIKNKVQDAKYEQNLLYGPDGFLVPPLRLRELVSKGNVYLAEDFIIGGQKRYRFIQDVLQQNQINIHQRCRILDFGVGCGRVARYFIRDQYESFHGVDVDPELIAWCSNHLNQHNAVFSCSNYSPPLDFGDSSFDLAYALSVFTHLDHESQKRWLEELARVLNQDGYLLISFLENKKSDVLEKPRNDSYLKRSWIGRYGAPKQYRNTYNSFEYLSGIAKKYFDVVDYKSKPFGKQSIILLKKKAYRAVD